MPKHYLDSIKEPLLEMTWDMIMYRTGIYVRTSLLPQELQKQNQSKNTKQKRDRIEILGNHTYGTYVRS